jgi:hypothetical protein
MFTFLAKNDILKKFFGTSQDFHKSVENIYKKFDPSRLKNFL